jgi:ABC-type transporter Mla subunit MlaD
MHRQRVFSLFLLAFGLAGYIICIPLTFYAQSAITAASPALDDVSRNLSVIQGAVVDAETTLTEFNTSLGSILDAIAAFDLSSVNALLNATITDVAAMLNETQDSLASVEQMLNDTDTTVDVIENMLNETIFTIDAVTVMLTDNAAWLELFGNNSAFQLLAPEVTLQALAIAASMRSTATVLGELPLGDAVVALQGLPLLSVRTALRSLPLTVVTDSLTTLQAALQPFLHQLETAIQETRTMLLRLQTYLGTITPQITETHITLDAWSVTIHTVKSQLHLIQLGVYGIIIYILCLHTGFIILGVHLKRAR